MFAECLTQFRFLDDSLESVPTKSTTQFLRGKVTAVVYESLVVAVVVLPKPVQCSELTEVWIEIGDVVSTLVALEIDEHIRVQGSTHMDWKVYPALRNLIRFMQRHTYGNVWSAGLPYFVHVKTISIFADAG